MLIGSIWWSRAEFKVMFWWCSCFWGKLKREKLKSGRQSLHSYFLNKRNLIKKNSCLNIHSIRRGTPQSHYKNNPWKEICKFESKIFHLPRAWSEVIWLVPWACFLLCLLEKTKIKTTLNHKIARIIK